MFLVIVILLPPTIATSSLLLPDAVVPDNLIDVPPEGTNKSYLVPATPAAKILIVPPLTLLALDSVIPL